MLVTKWKIDEMREGSTSSLAQLAGDRRTPTFVWAVVAAPRHKDDMRGARLDWAAVPTGLHTLLARQK